MSDWSTQIGTRLGFRKAVLVQPSIYGIDNSCLIDNLGQLTPKHGRGVVELDPSLVTQEQIQDWYGLGVRGARVNLKSVGNVLNCQELQHERPRYASLIRPFDWVLEANMDMAMISSLESVTPDLRIRFCIDHYGHSELPLLDPHKQFDQYKLKGFPSLDPHMADIEAITEAFLREAPDRLIYATDWPHTRSEGIDRASFAENYLEWCGEDHSLFEKLFKTNAEELWDVEGSHLKRA